ncbi:MAG TPA: ABC transporter ATP-binding protein [Candidatus Sulfotelmatobacter sp.]|nr:ABC transporter ATP-binding protein [Candidatus Sulfotelmatobacter sp.]
MTEPGPALALDALRIAFALRAGELTVVPGISLAIAPGEAYGLVGESGCGKSTIALAVMRALGRTGRITGGRILIEGRDVTLLDEAALDRIRGSRVAMVYQDPASSLNPVMPVGRQLMEVPMLHRGADRAAARAQALAMLREVALPDPERLFERYPHELSGGQQQRIVIAMALIAEPALLILDEPTTGLDVTVEASILALVRALRRRFGTAILFISHNLGTVAQICDRVGVLYGGELVEEGSIRQVFRAPRHPYTRALFDCLPNGDKHARRLVGIPGQPPALRDRPRGCGFAPRCAFVDPARCIGQPIALSAAPDDATQRARCVRQAELPPPHRADPAVPAREPAAPVPDTTAPAVTARGLTKVFRRHGLFGRRGAEVMALDRVALDAPPGRTLAIVGESGSGKSTFARILGGLETATDGSLRIDGAEIAQRPVERRAAAFKRQLQMVFQNPDATLNPSHSVGYAIARAVRRLDGLGGAASRRRAAELMAAVQLPPALAAMRPHQLSGGQKQRVAIARALASAPAIVIADEPVSALDVSVQASIVNLLAGLQAERGVTLLFVSHDLAVVRFLADTVAVMYLGTVVEHGRVEEVFAPPHHPYTAALLAAMPSLDPDARPDTSGETPAPHDAASAAPRSSGCPFAPRCPRHIGPVCDTPLPERQLSPTHVVRCHLDEFARSSA